MWFDNNSTTWFGSPSNGFNFINTALIDEPHPVLFNIAQTGSVTFAKDLWHKSSDGKNRFNYESNGRTIFVSGDGRHHFQTADQSNLTFSIDNYGNVIATGAANATAFNTTSDSRIKTNVSTIDSPLEKLMRMRGVYYNRIDDSNTIPDRHVGVIAQEVEEVLPEVVFTDTSENKNKSVAYGNIVALLIEAVKAQQSTIDSLLLTRS